MICKTHLGWKSFKSGESDFSILVAIALFKKILPAYAVTGSDSSVKKSSSKNEKETLTVLIISWVFFLEFHQKYAFKISYFV